MNQFSHVAMVGNCSKDGGMLELSVLGPDFKTETDNTAADETTLHLLFLTVGVVIQHGRKQLPGGPK